MNLLIAWNITMNTGDFEAFIKKLGVKNLFALQFENKHDFKMENVKYVLLDGYAPFNFYEKSIIKCIPLDGDILTKMQPYERMALGIVDRWKSSYTTRSDFAEIWKIYNIYLRYWNDFIIKNKIDFFIMDGAPHIPAYYFPYALCKIHGIKTIHGEVLPTIKGDYITTFFVNDVEGFSDIYPKIYSRLSEEYKDVEEGEIPISSAISKYFKTYSDDPNDVKGKTSLEVVADETRLGKINRYVNRARLYTKTKRYGILARKVIYTAKIKPKTNAILKYVETLEEIPDISKDFVFFPLHYQPESATLPHGGYFDDQHLAISMVAAALPEGKWLYVKEHPIYWKMTERVYCMSERRSKAYYDEIVRIPNVKLIKHDFPASTLIESAKALVTINGSAGNEALFLGKPVIMFGNAFYMYAPGVRKVRSNNECREAVEEAISGEFRGITKKELKIYFKSFEGFVSEITMRDNILTFKGTRKLSKDEDVRRLTSAMSRFIKAAYPEAIKD